MIAETKTPAARYGMTHRRRSLQRLRRLHGGLRRREQYPAGRRRRHRSHRPHLDPRLPGRQRRRGPDRRSAFIPVLCQHCGKDAPCVSVCPQQAVEVDPATGVVGQMPERCLGCRYCMAACPYHARYFNWWDPGVARRHGEDPQSRRGSAHARRGREVQLLPRPLARRQGEGRGPGKAEIDPADYVPACVEACPNGAIPFGNLNDPASEPRKTRASRTASACSNRSAPIPRFTTTPRRPGCAKSPAPRARGKENARG